MKYKIKNHIIEAKSPVEALKIHKLLDSVKDEDTVYLFKKYGEHFTEISKGSDGKYHTILGVFKTLDKALEHFKMYTWVRISYDDYKKYKNSRKPEDMDYLRKKYKDSVKDSLTREEKQLVDYCIENTDHKNDADELIKIMKVYYSAYADLARRKPNEIKQYFKQVVGDSMKDSQEEIDYLTEEEERAVDDYRQAIANTNNPKLLKLYQHILGEELEHIEELSSAEVVEDSCKTKDDRLNISSLLIKAKEFAENEEYQKVANVCFNIIQSLKQMKEAK